LHYRFLEAHILDFNGDLYQQTLTLEFVARLRPEQRFSSLEELKAQIQKDIRTAREILNHVP
jgi:riboflavin kinase/FMN adenylyltransferase